ncbi:heme-degrading monooxygenase HmoA [Kibdelosporangium banguiense]|uniref:Heme-degrading monooxygenase HmoA n=1 Tax=Kibdelosporangium banguiense TaxID=1365924 RepID=A0ABS4TS64_9PSEU|nr:antibiotic biosynthesis monooxygenase family protein [Kibdelosporangium banguiense]MBP2327257.1 heme-degrading monooxygenase HmoA [Kibdelosporangium banguiense]
MPVFRVMLRMRIKPGMEREFERAWLQIGDSVTSHPANIGQWLSRSAEEDGVYYIVSDWVDEPRFREFETSDRHLNHRKKLHPYRSDGSMVTMHVVAHLPGVASPESHEDWEAAR